MDASLLPAPLTRSVLLRERLVIEPGYRTLYQTKSPLTVSFLFGDPGGIRTRDLLDENQIS